jgi:hypothetical protein
MSQVAAVKGSAAPGAVSHIGAPHASTRTAFKVVVTDFMSADHVDALAAKAALEAPENQTRDSWVTVKARLGL